MARSPLRRRTPRPHRRPALLAAVTTASLAAGALTLLSPVAAAAPCDPWPPAGIGGGGSGSLSGSAGGSSNRPVTPWANGEQGYIPVLEGRTNTIQLLTGPTSPNDTVDRFGIWGTDLGIMWDNGNAATPQVMMALGDTMGDCSVPGDQWRSNILFRSGDRELNDGMNIDDAPMEREGMAKSILPRSNRPGETTVIPTAGVEVDGTQYLRYMSVAIWDPTPGEWTTNYSALARSTDNGENWVPVSGTARRGTAPMPLPANLGEEFTRHTDGQMSAFLKHREDGEDYVYEYLTPSGRSGSARLARVPEDQIADMTAYEYWNGEGWSGQHSEAVPVLGAPTINSTVSELSVTWSEHLGRFIALYNNRANNIVMAQAESPEGPWSGEDILVSNRQVPSLYGAFTHPWSPAVEADGNELYYTMSTWDAYNVFLMRTDLSDIPPRNFPNPNARMRATDDSWIRNTPDPAETGETVLVERRPIPGA